VKPAIYLYAVAGIAAGVINLIWLDFATGSQPIQAFGDHVPGRELYAVVTAVALIAGGVLILRPKTEAAGAATLAIVYGIFAIFWLPRFYWVIHLFGADVQRIFGVISGVGEQMILVAAAIAVWAVASPLPRPAALNAARWTFGLSCIGFGLNHYLSVAAVAALVPTWLPPNPSFWVILTGTGFLLAGIAILARIYDVPAARLLAVQLLVFSALVCLPWIFHAPRGHEAWGGNAYNLTAVGAALILASLAARGHRTAQ